MHLLSNLIIRVYEILILSDYWWVPLDDKRKILLGNPSQRVKVPWNRVAEGMMEGVEKIKMIEMIIY